VSEIRWSAVQTWTVVDVTGERVTFRERTCSLCGNRYVDDPAVMAQHAEDHKTGQCEKQERATFERIMALNEAGYRKAPN
jgi:ribosomal protein S27AE